VRFNDKAQDHNDILILSLKGWRNHRSNLVEGYEIASPDCIGARNGGKKCLINQATAKIWSAGRILEDPEKEQSILIEK